MGFLDEIYFFFLINNLIIIIIFWLLSFIGSFFFKKNEFFLKNDFYECGFKSFSDFNFKLNTGAFITMIFVVLYDLEFLITIPFLLNSKIIYGNFLFSVYFLYISILLTFIIDLYEDVIVWDFR